MNETIATRSPEGDHPHHHHHGPATPTAALRHEHELILRAIALAEGVGGKLVAGEAVERSTLTWLIEFFRTFADKCHHWKEEQHLFPALARRGVPVEGGPIGVMLAEHEEGRRLLRLMAEGSDREAAGAVKAYAALLRAHIDKENGILFPLAEQVLSEAEQQGLADGFDAIEQTMLGSGAHERLVAELLRMEAAATGGEIVVDVRPVAPRDRHPMIFQTFEGLGAGEAFVLVNDHDPKPLYYQFSAERAGQFSWEYLEQGPEVWRVRIGKTAA